MEIKRVLHTIKIWVLRIFAGGGKRPKLPRKKIQLQFGEVKSQFEKHRELLEEMLKQSELYPSTRMMGDKLLEEVKRFEELELVSINEKRLKRVENPLLHPVDISLWAIYQMHSYVEEIYHFIKTLEVVEL